MNDELPLKLQAHLDGELPGEEHCAVEAQIAVDPQARALMQELRFTRSALAVGEIPRPLPESREFFWSKIQREIQRNETRQSEGSGRAVVPWWRRWLVPTTGIAVVAIAVFLGLRTTGIEDRYLIKGSMGELGTLTYRNAQEGVTLVWLNYPADDDAGSINAGMNSENK